MASINALYSCLCLNVRVTVVPREPDAMKINVMHYGLVDFLLDEKNLLNWFLVCLLCQRPVCFRRLFIPNRLCKTIKFNDEPLESVILPVNNNEPCTNVLTQLGLLTALNSPSYSPTFKVLSTTPFGVTSDRDPSAFEVLLLDRYPTQLADVVSSLCDVAIRHNQQLRHDVLLTSHLNADSIDIVGDQIRTRSDFQILCKGLWDRQQTIAMNLIQKTDPFEVFIGVYLARIDAAFSEMRATSRRDSSASVDSIEAIALMGISDRYQRHSSPKVLPGRGFGDLPTETSWKIFHYLEPVYFPMDLIAVQDYYKDISAFAQFSLVSKSWLELTIPSLYRCIVLLGEPTRLNKLSHALKVRGPLVHTVVIDDIDIGLVHIRSCSPYFNKCLSLCPNVHHVQCNGDIGLDASRMHTLSSLAVVLPQWLPVDFSAIFRFAGPDLRRLDISKWTPREKDETSVLPSTLPQLDAFSISDSIVSSGLLERLLGSMTKGGRNVLRELSIVNISTLDGPGILQLLKINALSAHITVLRVRLHQGFQRDDNDGSLRDILAICPCLIEFSYTSPSSPEIFTHLPQTLRTLELAVMLPHLISAMPRTAMPRITTVEPFIEYLGSPASRNIRRLSIIRRVLQWDRVTRRPWRRLDTQTWDWKGELRGICKERNIQLSRSVVLDIYVT